MAIFQIGLKKSLGLKKLKTLCCGLKTNKKEFKVEKVTKRKDDKLNLKWKGYNISFNSSLNFIVQLCNKNKI